LDLAKDEYIFSCYESRATDIYVRTSFQKLLLAGGERPTTLLSGFISEDEAGVFLEDSQGAVWYLCKQGSTKKVRFCARNGSQIKSYELNGISKLAPFQLFERDGRIEAEFFFGSGQYATFDRENETWNEGPNSSIFQGDWGYADRFYPMQTGKIILFNSSGKFFLHEPGQGPQAVRPILSGSENSDTRLLLSQNSAVYFLDHSTWDIKSIDGEGQVNVLIDGQLFNREMRNNMGWDLGLYRDKDEHLWVYNTQGSLVDLKLIRIHGQR
jgi:hypothetical protein